MKPPPQFDPVFHQPVRTRLCLMLNKKPASFKEIKTTLDMTDGNLDAHLKKLSLKGFLESEMLITPRPRTIYQLSPSGRKAFKIYLNALQQTIKYVGKARTKITRK